MPDPAPTAATRRELFAPSPARITPLALLGLGRATKVLQRNFVVYRRGWRFLVSGFFEPFFYLVSIGLGLSKLVGAIHVGGHTFPYTVFVAPGLLAASAMNGAIFDCTFKIFFQLKIMKVYDSMLSTPLSPRDVAVGELLWALARGTLYCGVFLCVMAGFGYVGTPWAILCLPGSVCVSYAFAGVAMAGTSYMRSWQDFDFVFLAALPMFLFSATFYPLAVYPGWLQLVVRCTPLYQAVALQRGLDLGLFTVSLLGHLIYLLVMGTLGLWVTSRRLANLCLP
ncbi:MAG: ABC transporter permease [Acidimicrobiales bacterium]